MSADLSRTPPARDRRLVLVAGSGRSGTSLLAGTLQQLGYYVPQPEVQADPTNPKGFGEPRWVVDLHARLLRQVRVHPSDARPAAWYETGKVAMAADVGDELQGWLAQQFEIRDDVVVKDPRLSWFFPAWRRAAQQAAAAPLVLTMLRHPVEVIGSKANWYGTQLAPAARLAGWLNMMLFTERATRGTARAFIHYTDLLEDWPRTLGGLADRFDLAPIRAATVPAMRRIYDFVDPELHRTQTTWADVDVPSGLRDLADSTWEQLSRLADPSSSAPGAEPEAELDGIRAEYVRLYQESEAIAASSIVAARPLAKASGAHEPAGQAPPAPAATADPRPGADGVISRAGLLARIPEHHRRRVPAPVRRGARRAVEALSRKGGA